MKISVVICLFVTAFCVVSTPVINAMTIAIGTPVVTSSSSSISSYLTKGKDPLITTALEGKKKVKDAEEKNVADPIDRRSETLDDIRERRSPFDHLYGFHVVDLERPYGYVVEANEIPPQTQDEFTPPDPPTKEGRRKKYRSNHSNIIPPAAYIIVEDEPFFDSFDHAKAILGLESYRKRHHIPLHKLQSLRPFFPFFVKD